MIDPQICHFVRGRYTSGLVIREGQLFESRCCEVKKFAIAAQIAPWRPATNSLLQRRRAADQGSRAKRHFAIPQYDHGDVIVAAGIARRDDFALGCVFEYD